MDIVLFLFIIYTIRNSKYHNYAKKLSPKEKNQFLMLQKNFGLSRVCGKNITVSFRGYFLLLKKPKFFINVISLSSEKQQSTKSVF